MPTNTNTLPVLRKPVYLVVLECVPIFPEDPAGGDDYQLEAPGGAGNDAPALAGPCEPGGGALGGDGFLTMFLPVWPDEDGSKGGKRYPGITLRNLVEVPQFPEERDGKGGKVRASIGTYPRFDQEDDEDEEYREEEEEEGEEWLPSDRPQFVSVGVGQ